MPLGGLASFLQPNMRRGGLFWQASILQPKPCSPQKNVPLGDAEENEDGLNFKMMLSVCNDVQLF